MTSLAQYILTIDSIETLITYRTVQLGERFISCGIDNINMNHADNNVVLLTPTAYNM